YLHPFFLLIRRPPTSPLFPYTTLFRSVKIAQSKKHERVRRDAFPQSLILLHHGGKRILHPSSLQSVKVNCEFVMVSPEISCLFEDRKSTRLNSSHRTISYAVFCLKKKI